MIIITEDEYRNICEDSHSLSSSADRHSPAERRNPAVGIGGAVRRNVGGKTCIVVKGRYLGNSLQPLPLPGHSVIITENDDPLAPPGTMGVIAGMLGNFSEFCLISFNLRSAPLKDDKLCSASGTPTYRVKAEDLVFTGRTVLFVFRHIGAGRLCRDSGDTYGDEVLLFELKTSFAKRRTGVPHADG